MSGRSKTVLLIGETLLVLQKLERFLAAILMNMATPSEPDGKLSKALLQDKETLGRLIKHFSERNELPQNFATTFEQLLKDRNVFVHALFMQPWFDLNTDDGLARVNEFMRNIRAASKIAIQVMMGSLTPQDTDAERSEETQRYIDNILKRMNDTALPDFGGLSPDEYVAKVQSNAKAAFAVKRRDA
jgi:hypothetical protein